MNRVKAVEICVAGIFLLGCVPPQQARLAPPVEMPRWSGAPLPVRVGLAVGVQQYGGVQQSRRAKKPSAASLSPRVAQMVNFGQHLAQALSGSGFFRDVQYPFPAGSLLPDNLDYLLTAGFSYDPYVHALTEILVVTDRTGAPLKRYSETRDRRIPGGRQTASDQAIAALLNDLMADKDFLSPPSDQIRPLPAPAPAADQPAPWWKQ